MPKFQVLSGKHVENDRVFKPGDVVESNSDLDKKFANKFQRVMETVPATIGEPTPKLAEKLRQEEIAGENKKEEIPELGATEPPAPEPARTPMPDLGHDVTDSWPEAAQGGFAVWKKGLHYNITKDGSVVNEVPLKKKEVDPFLEPLLKNSD